MTVKILVLEKDTKKPIGYVSVRIANMERSYSDYTDANGWAYFDNLVEDKYEIKIRSPNHRPYTEKQNVSRNSLIEIKLQKATI